MRTPKSNEQGSARLKFLLVLLIIGGVAYAGYLYVPVAYQAYLFKDLMQQKVDVASASGYPPTWVGEQLIKSLTEYDVPPDALISPATRDQRVEVRVQFTRPIEFPGYTYQYEFDHTVRSTPFFNIK
ncbi:MAG TPA: hypothetical protein VF074_10575 [Pyrinomonadaceae bacterium]